MEVLFIRKYPTRNSGGSSISQVFTKLTFVTGGVKDTFGKQVKNRYNIQYCTYGGYSHSICQMDVETFETVFSKAEIKEMQINGMLDYDSTVDMSRYKSLSKKYPMFGAKIYKKYGIDISVMEEK